MDAKKLEAKYQEFVSAKPTFKISQKQINYITGLYTNGDKEIFVYLSELLEKELTDWSKLSKKEVGYIIARLKAVTPLTIFQIGKLQHMYKGDLKRISVLLRKNILKFTELTLRDFSYLIRTPEKFRLVSKEYPLYSHTLFEFGYQDSKHCKDDKLYYLKFYSMLMIDFDDIKLDQVVDKLNSMVQQNSFVFRIYQTFNGFHAFLISNLVDHNSEIANQIMIDLQCDEYYRLFAYKYGFKVRLSPKLNRDETYIAKYVKTVGNKTNIDHTCQKLINVHDKYVKRFNSNIGN